MKFKGSVLSDFIYENLILPLKQEFQSGKSRGTIFYTLSSGLKVFIQIATSLIVARMVLPEDIGVWKSVVLIQTYISFLQFGVLEGLNRQFPLYIGAGDSESAEKSARSSFSYILLISIFSGLLVLLIAGLYWLQGQNIKTITALVLFTAQAVGYPLWQYYDVRFRSSQKFIRLSWVQILESLYLIFSIGFVIGGNWTGLFLRFAFIFPVGLLIRFFSFNEPINLSWNWMTIRELIRVGWKVMFSIYLYGLVNAADMTLIALLLDQEQVGLYSIAVTVRSAISVFPNAITRVMFPRMTEKFGRTQDPSTLKKITFLPVIYNGLILLVPSVILYFSIEPLISLLLPAYINAIPAGKWMVLSGFFVGLRSSVNLFRSLNRLTVEIILYIGAIVMMYGFGYFSIQKYQSIGNVGFVNFIVMVFLTLGINLGSYLMLRKFPGVQKETAIYKM